MSIAPDNPVRVGVLGLGRASTKRILPGIFATPGLTLTAVTDLIPQRVADAVRQFGCRGHASMDALLADADVDWIVIATRSHEHAAHAIAALNAGKHVLVEKPMATSLADADRMIADAKVSDHQLLVRHNRRFDPDFVHAMRVIDQGLLGRVFAVQIRQHLYERRADWQSLKHLGGGQLLNWGPHVADWALQFFGPQTPQVLSHTDRVVSAGDAEDFVKLVLRRDGLVVDAEICAAAALPSPRFLVTGELGTLSISDGLCTLRHVKQLPPVTASDASPGLTGGKSDDTGLSWHTRTWPADGDEEHDYWQAFAAFARDSSRPIPTLAESRRVMTLLGNVRG